MKYNGIYVGIIWPYRPKEECKKEEINSQPFLQQEVSFVNRQHRPMKEDETFSTGQVSNEDGYIMQVEEASADEIVEGEVLERPSTQEEKLEYTKILSICRFFVTWPKLSFGELS